MPALTFLSALVDALLPARCVLCGEQGTALCAPCQAMLPRNAQACARCALPMAQAEAECARCQRHPPPFDLAYSAWRYAPPLDSLVQKAKFGASLACLQVLTAGLGETLDGHLCTRELGAPEALLPIPLHLSRLRQRGYNQAAEIARCLSRRLRLPVRRDLLLRVRATAPQPGLGLRERRRNLRGAFALGTGELPAHVALIDDVMTSGATVGAAAMLLRSAGVQRIEVWTLARRP